MDTSVSQVKICPVCGVLQQIDQFQVGKKSRHTVVRCKACRDATYSKGDHLKKFYGITLLEYDTMARSQDWKCAICYRKSNGDLVVDHDHITGKVRGLLCSACNQGLGHFYDSEESLLNAVGYLRAHSHKGEEED